MKASQTALFQFLLAFCCQLSHIKISKLQFSLTDTPITFQQKRVFIIKKFQTYGKNKYTAQIDCYNISKHNWICYQRYIKSVII